MNEENVDKNLSIFASKIHDRFKNWFTLNKLKKVKEVAPFQDDERLALIYIMCQKGLAHHKVEGNTDKFKITLSSDVKISLLEDDIKEYENKIEIIKNQIQNIKNGKI